VRQPSAAEYVPGAVERGYKNENMSRTRGKRVGLVGGGSDAAKQPS
jgi:hypothetical protein